MNKLLSNLGLCRRAGKLTLGFDAVVGAIKRDEVKCLLMTADLSPKTEKELRYQMGERQIPIYRLTYTMEEFKMVSKKKVGIFAVTDEQLAQLIQNTISAQIESPKEAENL